MGRLRSKSQLSISLAAIAAVCGIAAWAAHFQADLVLSHYDAKAHLVVARRVFDNLTPGWQQIGAVWLPLPHLLNLLPTQVDVFYRTGLAASALSIASFALCCWATARLVLAVTGSSAGAITAVALLALNPNLLYLQATPMTEPLLVGLSALVVLLVFEWVEADADHVPPPVGLSLAALAWTRYEGWAVVGATVAAATFALWRRGAPVGIVMARTARLAAWPAVAVLVFLVNSRITVGAWFVTGGFYVPDPTYQGKVWRTLVSLWWGTHQLSGYLLASAGIVSATALAIRMLRRDTATSILPIALLAAGALPFYAFVSGHPYRIRYMVPLVAASAALAGIGVGLAGSSFTCFKRRALVSWVAAGALVISTVVESPPWARNTPLLLEAQWDRPNSIGRRRVTACLAGAYHGEKILTSMGSLAHYMQELSSHGFDIADFINEGNGVIWNMALESGPAPHAGWMLAEEQAEGGDVLAQRIRSDAAFASGMLRVCDGGGVALYKRTPQSAIRNPQSALRSPQSAN